jgi:small subunit ribosomal protein S6
MYVIVPTVGEDGVAELHTQIEGIVTDSGGQIQKTDNWGRRRLAYEIGRHKEGTYVLELFTGHAEVVRELDRRLKVSDDVLRHLIVRVDEDLRKAERARAKRQTRQQRRRAAKGSAGGSEPVSPVSSASVDAGGSTEAANLGKAEVQE